MPVDVFNKHTWVARPTRRSGVSILCVHFLTPVYKEEGRLSHTRSHCSFYLFQTQTDSKGFQIRWVPNPGEYGLPQHFLYVDHERLDERGKKVRIDVTEKANSGGFYDVLLM